MLHYITDIITYCKFISLFNHAYCPIIVFYYDDDVLLNCFYSGNLSYYASADSI